MRIQAAAVSDIAEICAIADSAEQALAEAAQIAPGAERLRNLDQLLARELDGLVIATPNALHASQAIAALTAGTAVFCQKPVGRSVNEVGEVIHAARQADRRLASDFVYRFRQGMQAIRDLIRRGDLGRIYAADLCFHNSFGPDKPWYYNDALSGGGCMIDLGTHLVNLAFNGHSISLRFYAADEDGGEPQAASVGRLGHLSAAGISRWMARASIYALPAVMSPSAFRFWKRHYQDARP